MNFESPSISQIQVTFSLALLLVLRISLFVKFLRISFLIVAICWIGTIRSMSKRSASFVPAEADMVRLKRMMDSPVSRSDSSSEPCEGSDCDL